MAGASRYARPTHWVEVERFATCRSCGDKDLAWQQSKEGRWYLCQARERGGVVGADRRGFHCCTQRKEKTRARANWECPTSAEARLMVEIVAAGYRALAMKLHPDRGGSADAMQCLNAAVERLCDGLTRLSS